jgi:hypothetical protein
LRFAANNPLLQAWFVRTSHHDAHDPYFFYGVECWQLFALLSYPVLFEPALTLHTQNWLWNVGLLLIVLIASCSLLMLRVRGRMALHAKTKVGPKPDWLIIGRWVFISAVPSGLLVAVTAYISTDIAAAPLLWVIPLSLYLLTWVLVFQRRPLIPHRMALLLQPFAVVGIVALLLYAGWLGFLLSLAAHLLAFLSSRWLAMASSPHLP